jgi:DNA-binding transcriptional regulator YiaG
MEFLSRKLGASFALDVYSVLGYHKLHKGVSKRRKTLLEAANEHIMGGMALVDHPLKRWRQKHRVTQAELARQCGMRQGTLARYEAGSRVPRGAALIRLMEATGLPAEALILPVRFLEQRPDFLRPKRPPEEK